MKMFEDENGDEVENGDHDEDDDNDYDTCIHCKPRGFYGTTVQYNTSLKHAGSR